MAKNEFKLNGTATVLVAARNKGNHGATNKKFFEDNGADNGAFAVWKAHVEDQLQPAYEKYLKAGMYRIPQKKELDALRVPCFDALTKVFEDAGLGTPNGFDFEATFAFIEKHVNIDEVSYFGTTGKKAFRKLIEVFIGLKLTEAEVLSTDDTDVVKKYQAAVKRIDRLTATIEKATTEINKYTGKRDAKNTAKSTKQVYQELIDDYITEREEAEKKLKEAIANKDKLSAKYADIQLRLAKVQKKAA